MTRKPGQWWDGTVNWQAGCRKCSSGCEHCWALAMSRRMAANPKAPSRYTDCADGPLRDGGWSRRIVFDGPACVAAFRKINGSRTSKVWFLGDMTDLYSENAPPEAWQGLAKGIKSIPINVGFGGEFQTLVLVTKRPTRLLEFQRFFFPRGLPDYVWALCSVCCQEDADRLLPAFLEVIGNIGVHCEPLLGPVNLRKVCMTSKHEMDTLNPCSGRGLKFVAVGPENGPHARPCDLDWVRSLRDQTVAAGVPFFLKSGLPLDGATHRETPWSPHAD